jgi:hypothetical protein
MNWGESFLVLWLIVLIWDIIWRGIALWKAAQNKSKGWFVALLIVNSIGILPIIYLLLNRSKSKKSEMNFNRGSGLISLIIALAASLFGVLFSRDQNSSPSAVLVPPLTLTLTPTPTVPPTPTRTPTSTPRPTAKTTPVAVSGPPGAGYSSLTVSTPKGNFSARVLSIDLSSTRVVTDTANDSDCSDNCSTLPLSAYISRNGGYAGVNGTYFCPASYPDCSSKKDSFDFSVYNSRLSKWINGSNLSWGGRAIVYFDGSGAHYKQNASDFSGGLTAGIVNYPGLVNDGNVQIDDNQSGLSDKQKVKNTKIGIGIRNSNTVLVVVASNVNMLEFAHVFKSLGAVGALNLDTGGSAAVHYSGQNLIGPGRNLPNAIVFVHH